MYLVSLAIGLTVSYAIIRFAVKHGVKSAFGEMGLDRPAPRSVILTSAPPESQDEVGAIAPRPPVATRKGSFMVCPSCQKTTPWTVSADSEGRCQWCHKAFSYPEE